MFVASHGFLIRLSAKRYIAYMYMLELCIHVEDGQPTQGVSPKKYYMYVDIIAHELGKTLA